MRIDSKYPSKRYGEFVSKSDIIGFHFDNLAGNLKLIKINSFIGVIPCPMLDTVVNIDPHY